MLRHHYLLSGIALYFAASSASGCRFSDMYRRMHAEAATIYLTRYSLSTASRFAFLLASLIQKGVHAVGCKDL
eukprot:4122390-Pleurochrysis_carterae.AAC.1